MFRRQPDTRRICPVCRKRIRHEAERYCNNCNQDFTGEWIKLEPSIFELGSEYLYQVLGRREGHYVYADLTKPQKPSPVLLIAAHRNYVSFSTDGRVIHLPMADLYSVVEYEGTCSILLRHQSLPDDSGLSWWVGIEK